MTDLYKYEFKHPVFTELDHIEKQKIERALEEPDVYASNDMRLPTLTLAGFSTLRLEKHRGDNEAFREYASDWHVDSNLQNKWTELFTSSTGTSFVSGTVIFQQSIIDHAHKLFYSNDRRSRGIVDVAIGVTYTLFGIDWVEELIGTAPKSQMYDALVDAVTVDNISIVQAPPMTIAGGFDTETLHKSTRRKPDEPENRFFGINTNIRQRAYVNAPQ